MKAIFPSYVLETLHDTFSPSYHALLSVTSGIHKIQVFFVKTVIETKKKTQTGKMRTHLFSIAAAFLAVIAFASAEDDFENDDDVQTEFYLHYSETEDVDFSITRDAGYGCYQW